MHLFKQHMQILNLLEKDHDISSTDELPVSWSYFKELLSVGLVTGIDASSSDGNVHLKPRITLAGRSILLDYKDKHSLKGRLKAIYQSIRSSITFAALCVSLAFNAIQLLP